jgi:hypothetical protein
MGEAKRRGVVSGAEVHEVINAEAVLAAHDALHKDDVETAHQCLHAALCIDANTSELPIAPLAHVGGFDHGFITACRKNGVRAAYIMIDPHAKPDNGRYRLVSGGDQELSRVLDRTFRKP